MGGNFCRYRRNTISNIERYGLDAMQIAVQQVARVRNEAEELKRDAVELVTGVRNKPDMGR